MKQILMLLIVLLVGVVAASDIAYITENQNLIDENIVNAITELGYDIEYVDDSEIQSKDFSKYKMLLIPNQGFVYTAEYIPVNEFNTLIISKNNLEVWGWVSGGASQKGSSHFLTANIVDSSSYITENMPKNFQIYKQIKDNELSIPIYYLSKYKRAIGLNVLVSEGEPLEGLVVKSKPGTRLKNGKISHAKGVFFGITETKFWTNESKNLFQNSVVWLMGDIDRDGDGYNEEEDCNDYDPQINPGAKEIPYDGIDQNCDGKDLTDVDGDGYDAEIVGGEDCDDNDASVYPGANNILKDCSKDNPKNLETINMCEFFNSNINIKIKSPKENDDFTIEEIIPIKIEIENNFLEELKFNIETKLYGEKGYFLEENDESIDIEEGKRGEIELELKISKETEKGDYLLYVYVEDEYERCSFDYVKIKIERPKHKVIIDKIEVQESISAGDSLYFNFRIENQGLRDEEVYILVENSKLNISEKSEIIEIEKYGEDDSEKIQIKIDVPEDAKEGEYEFDIILIYDDGKDEKEISILIVEKQEQKKEKHIASMIKIGTNNEEIIKLTKNENLEENRIKIEGSKNPSTDSKEKNTLQFDKKTGLVVIDLFLILGIMIMGGLLIVYREKIMMNTGKRK